MQAARVASAGIGAGRSGARGAVAMRSAFSQTRIAELKRAVLTAIAEVRRVRTPEAKESFLNALEALEMTPSDVLDIEGRWSLVYSTDVGATGAGVPDPLQQAFNQAYKLFFRFAPALAGGQDVAFLSASNEQIVDLASGTVDNTVTLRPPVGGPVVLGVRGLVAQEDDGLGCFSIVFTESQLPSPFGPVRVPLPRPKGQITSTFSDGEMRVVRGSRGTLFVLQRLRD